MRPFFAVIVVATIGLAYACSDDHRESAPVYPTQPGHGTSSSSGGTTSSASSSGGSSSGNPASDGGADGGGDSGPAACTALSAQVDVHSIAALPTETGGTIADGSYVLTAAEDQDDAADGGVIGKRAATLVFSGKNVAWHYDTDTLGAAVDKCCVGTYSISDNQIFMGYTCMGDSFPTSYGGSFSAGTDAGVPQVRLEYGGKADVYTKQ